jgi:hypothetical protein
MVNNNSKLFLTRYALQTENTSYSRFDVLLLVAKEINYYQ